MSSLREPQARPDVPAESAALAISRALGADGAVERPSPRRPPAAVTLAALLLVAGTSGYIAGDSGSPPAKPREVEAGAVRLTLPQGWRQRQPRDGLELMATRPLVVTPPGDTGLRVVAAELPRRGLGLLPEAANARLDGVSAGEPVTLGGLRATRYRALESPAPRRRVTLFATPTRRGTALAACVAPRAPGDGCERVAATLSVAGAGPPSDAAEAAEAGRAIRRLDAGRGAAAGMLRRARSRTRRARLVRALVEVHADARSALERLPEDSRVARAGAPVTRALRGVERAYGGLAKALRGRSRRREQAARLLVRRRDARLRRAVERL